MSDLLGESVNYGSDCGNTTDADGGADASPSHASQSDMQNALRTDSEDSEESEGSQEFKSTMHEASMALRRKNIRKRKLQRRGIPDSDEEMSDEFESEFRKQTPYRKLSMPTQFTPPRKKSKVLVRDSDEEDNDENDDDDDDDDASTPLVPRRVITTSWKEIKVWSKSRHQLSDIDREIDGIMAQSLKNAGYHAEHVSKSKETDRAFWKEAHVSQLFSLTSMFRADESVLSHSCTAAGTMSKNIQFYTGALSIICVDAKFSTKYFTLWVKLCSKHLASMKEAAIFGIRARISPSVK